jgi:hypothetical protein
VLLKKATVAASASGVMRWRTPFCQRQVSLAANRLPERLLKTEGFFRRHHVIGIAMPEQQRPPARRRQLMADIPFVEAIDIKIRRGEQGLRANENSPTPSDRRRCSARDDAS